MDYLRREKHFARFSRRPYKHHFSLKHMGNLVGVLAFSRGSESLGWIERAVHGLLQAGILEWVAMPSSREYS